MKKQFAKVYAIVDAEVLAERGVGLREFAEGLRAAGVGLVQWRDKRGAPQEVLRGAAVLREVFWDNQRAAPGQAIRPPDLGHPKTWLIMNDRADLAMLAGFDGVHVGQGDLSADDAKTALGDSSPTHRMRQSRNEWGTQSPALPGGGIVGVSTHTEEQVRAADVSCADYIAIGPVFATGTKADAEAVVGLEGVRRARALTTKPLVAIGGITRANARSVIEAGADSVAVISALVSREVAVEQLVREMMEAIG